VTSFRDALKVELVSELMAWHPWSREEAEDTWRERLEDEAEDILARLLSLKSTVECPDCGGTGYTAVKEWRGPEHVNRCPAGCIDGRVPGETRLAIVEPAERLPAFSDVLREAPAVFLLAPDLPETEKP